MWAADFVANHTMEHLQSLILLGVFMNNRDRSEAAWALLGAAIKVSSTRPLQLRHWSADTGNRWLKVSVSLASEPSNRPSMASRSPCGLADGAA
jgi:hypothetical protein